MIVEHSWMPSHIELKAEVMKPNQTIKTVKWSLATLMVLFLFTVHTNQLWNYEAVLRNLMIQDFRVNLKIQNGIAQLNKIMQGAIDIVGWMHDDIMNVLVHCADGWDRTTILWSMAQVLLDPFYRTIQGFEVLIEKDWISFGHKFEDRWGHFRNSTLDPKERAPVLIMFLDCIYQLMNQFPMAFEFNNTFLLFLSHHLYTCKYGTFLCNNDYQRK